MSQLEKEIERKCRRIAEQNGCELLKIVSPNRTGVLDDIFTGFEGKIIWMEFKKLKKGPSSQQSRRLKRLRAMGHEAEIIKSVERFLQLTELKL